MAQVDLRDEIVKNGEYQQDAATANFRIDLADFDVLSVEVTWLGLGLGARGLGLGLGVRG